MQHTVYAAGSAAEKAEKNKAKKYAEISTQYAFQPLAVETLGSFSAAELAFIRKLGQKISLANAQPLATTFLFQAISIAIQRGNTASVLGTAPSSKPLEEVFYL